MLNYRKNKDNNENNETSSWIKCEDALPKKDEGFVAIIINCYDMKSNRNHNIWHRAYYSYESSSWVLPQTIPGKITHWMKIELPKEEKNE